MKYAPLWLLLAPTMPSSSSYYAYHSYLCLAYAYLCLGYCYLCLAYGYLALARAYILLAYAYLILSKSSLTLSLAYTFLIFKTIRKTKKF